MSLKVVKDRILQFSKERNVKLEVKYFLDHKDKLFDLVELLKSESNYPYPEYGSWLLCHLVKADKEIVNNYKPILIQLLNSSENNSLLRNLMNVLNVLPFKESENSALLDRCLHFIQDSSYKVALQVYSIYYIVNFIKVYPELKSELIQLVEIHYGNRSSAYKAAVKKFKEKVDKIS